MVVMDLMLCKVYLRTTVQTTMEMLGALMGNKQDIQMTGPRDLSRPSLRMVQMLTNISQNTRDLEESCATTK
jgi:hypothetical protein